MHAQKRIRLIGGEPKARKLVARTGARLPEVIAVGFAVVLDRGVETLPHVLEIPLDACARDAQLVYEGCEGDDLTVLQELVDLVEAFEPFHPPRSLDPLRWRILPATPGIGSSNVAAAASASRPAGQDGERKPLPFRTSPGHQTVCRRRRKKLTTAS